ncbi:MAG: isoprenylcysteine carboxylmethyltransferase family protein [Gemmatimonadetes bacterium]|nr:isoprenylcysteine carboxylmethyltransferase family protein [Gemmatimonadota bacterium]
MSTARYVIAVLLVISLPPAIVWWYVIHPFVGFWRKIGKPITYTVMTVLFLGSVVGLFAVRDALVLTDLGTSWIMVGVAAVLIIPAIWLAILRAKYLSFGILAGVPELDADGSGGKLLNQGIYAVIRHPRYVEIALGTLAYAAFANYLGGYILALLTIPGIHAVVVIEEKELAERFGEEYEAYRASVPRYIPTRDA